MEVYRFISICVPFVRLAGTSRECSRQWRQTGPVSIAISYPLPFSVFLALAAQTLHGILKCLQLPFKITEFIIQRRIATGTVASLNFGMGLGHTVENNADEEVEDDHGAEDDEGDEVYGDFDNRRVCGSAVEDVAPIVERHDAEQRQQRGAERAKILV